MKKLSLFIFIALIGFKGSILAQETEKPKSTTGGFRIHSMYEGFILSIPVSGLRQYVESAGLGFKFGSIFYFYKPGIADGTINFGLQTQYINFESNVPLAKVFANEDNPKYSIALAAGLGPNFSYKPSADLKLDLYYMFGTGFRLFPKYDEYIYGKFHSPADPHTRFTQSVGIAFHYKVLYVSMGLQMLSYKYNDYRDADFNYQNYKYENVTHRKKFTTFQLTIGTCGYRTK